MVRQPSHSELSDKQSPDLITNNMENLEHADSPIDFGRLREVSADDTELMNELIEMYFSQTRELLDSLKSAISEEDAEMVYKSAHKALGSSMTCGMNSIVPSLRELELIGRDSNLEGAEQLLSQAEYNFAQMDSYLQTNKGKLFN